MAPKARLKAHAGLPKGWRFKCGAYRYRVPEGLEHLWDGKKEFTLGKTLPEAYRTWAERIDTPADLPTMDKAFDRYLLEEVPTKSYSWQSTQRISITRLRKAFGKVRPGAIKPSHAYRYHDTVKKGSGETAARHDIQTLRHVLTKCVEWGAIDRNPIKGEIRIKKPAPRSRQIEDWEIAEVMTLGVPKLKKDGTPAKISRGILTCLLFIRLKLMTGLRRVDILAIPLTELKADGIHVTPTKTENTTGKRLIIDWAYDETGYSELRELVNEILAMPPRRIGNAPLFVTREGKSYLDENKETNGFDSIWQRFMDKVLKETKVTERFQQSDLRAKVADDSDTLQEAADRLSHSTTETTQRVYRRKPVRVLPLVRK